MRGTVLRLVPERRFGFIAGEDGREFFFQDTGLTATEFETLAEGHEVDFAVTEHAAGDEPEEHPRAVQVRLAPSQLPASDNEPLPPEKLGEG